MEEGFLAETDTTAEWWFEDPEGRDRDHADVAVAVEVTPKGGATHYMVFEFAGDGTIRKVVDRPADY